MRKQDHLFEKLEGESRPHFFYGVTKIVSKLFNVIQPSHTFFGEKDAQQVIIIQEMIALMNYPIKLICCPTIRDKNGLALSSRHLYLNSQEKHAATLINEGLFKALELFYLGEKRSYILCLKAQNIIGSNSLLEVNYIDIVNKDNFQKLTHVENDSLMIAAAKIGNIRLIDNIEIE